MSYFKNDSLRSYTTIIHKHTDAEGNIVAEQIDNEMKQVVDRVVLLEQIPHRAMGTEVMLEKKNLFTGKVEYIKLIEVDMREDITKSNQFKIDYNTGKLYVHYDLEGLNLKINYWGTGSVLLHASRVYTQLDANGDVVITLEELIESIKNMTDVTYIANLLREIEQSKISTTSGLQFDKFYERLDNIERDLKKNKDDVILIGNDVINVKENMDNVVQIVDDVEVRMQVLESNYLNPKLISNEEIDIILGGLE